MSQPLTPLRRICFLLSHSRTASGEDVVLLQIELGSSQAPADVENVQNTGVTLYCLCFHCSVPGMHTRKKGCRPEEVNNKDVRLIAAVGIKCCMQNWWKVNQNQIKRIRVQQYIKSKVKNTSKQKERVKNTHNLVVSSLVELHVNAFYTYRGTHQRDYHK